MSVNVEMKIYDSNKYENVHDAIANNDLHFIAGLDEFNSDITIDQLNASNCGDVDELDKVMLNTWDLAMSIYKSHNVMGNTVDIVVCIDGFPVFMPLYNDIYKWIEINLRTQITINVNVSLTMEVSGYQHEIPIKSKQVLEGLTLEAHQNDESSTSGTILNMVMSDMDDNIIITNI